MKKGEHIVLGIETSCDETSVAVIQNGREILSNIISSQIDIHKIYGGVVPEIASRHHLDNVNLVLEQALTEAEITLDDVDLVGVTCGPGLVGALLIGLSTAKAIAYAKEIPIVGVNHIKGHIFANFLEHKELEPPFLSLIISGGHTTLVDVRDYETFEILGTTRDDAAGEAFDKVARALGLGYPGGPKIDAAAKRGDPHAVAFKRVLLEKNSLDFSFSGLKTAVLNYLNSQKMKSDAVISIEDVAASFQAALVDVIVIKTKMALQQTKRKQLVLAGGVAANYQLRKQIAKMCETEGIALFAPSPVLCTDNAAMIGCAAYYQYQKGKADDLSLDAYPSLKIHER